MAGKSNSSAPEEGEFDPMVSSTHPEREKNDFDQANRSSDVDAAATLSRTLGMCCNPFQEFVAGKRDSKLLMNCLKK